MDNYTGVYFGKQLKLDMLMLCMLASGRERERERERKWKVVEYSENNYLPHGLRVFGCSP